MLRDAGKPRYRAGKLAKLTFFAGALAAAMCVLPRLFAQEKGNQQKAPPPVIEGYFAIGTPIVLGRAPGLKVFELGKTARSFRVRLAAGDEILSGLAAFVDKYQVKTSQFNGVGGLSSGITGWTDPEKRQLKKNIIDQKCELLSLSGEITMDANGKRTPHAHIVVGYADGSTRGGHLIEGIVAPFMDIYVNEMEN